MNIRNSKEVHGVTWCRRLVAGVLLATPGSVRQGGQVGIAGAGLRGSWRVRGSVKDCVTGVRQRTFSTVWPFAQKGVRVTQATAGQPPPALSLTDRFVWRHTGGQNYTRSNRGLRVLAGRSLD